THYRRHDLWYKLVLLAANAVHWFNPLMYLMVREAGADMELTCDAAVVAGADSGTRRAYSETLLAAVHRERGSAFSTHFYGGKKAMKERFRNILGKQGQKWGVLLLLLTLLATLTAAAAVRFQQAENSPDAEERDEISVYLDDKIAELAERGYAVSDERSKFTLEGEYSGDLWPDEIQVWHLDYALKLENPESYAPAGNESVDGGGWLSGIEDQGDPYFIFSVDHEQKTNELLEIAHANVPRELGYSWEEYICCHTILGMDLVRSGWPEITPEFLAAQLDGHQAGMADWEDVALTYLTVIMELEPPENGLSVLREFSREDGESRLIAAQCGEQKVYVLLVKNVYPEEAFSFWQVAGLCWQKRP
ncbi:MAG: M56 family metallopeptidase, partial [Oscillospiraceae bacterium]|nr:M56 family metallopeptidase [Oscillospiraceae bacterium]